MSELIWNEKNKNAIRIGLITSYFSKKHKLINADKWDKPILKEEIKKIKGTYSLLIADLFPTNKELKNIDKQGHLCNYGRGIL